jgi:hypothetical protein
MQKQIKIIILAFEIAILAGILGVFWYYEPQKFPESGYYTVVMLPDTQNYSSNHPEILKLQTKWIADNIKKENIVFAVSVGDIVNNYDNEKQWQNARTAYDLIQGKLPLGLLLGNHDMSQKREAVLFKKYFPFSANKKYNWEGEDFPAGTGYNSFQLFSIGKEKFIAIDLSLCPTNDVVAWANKILEKYADRKAILSTHGYLGLFAIRNISISKGQMGGCTSTPNNTQYIWDDIIAKNKNVLLVLSGHMHAVAKRIDYNDGKPVLQILADYQTEANGGNGWMRLLQFDVANKQIHVRTYSPYLNEYDTDISNDFVLNY